MLSPTEAPSTSPAASQLATPALYTRLGLVVPETLNYEEWQALGSKVVETAGSVMWLIGDWLAFGHDKFQDTRWGKRVPSELYAQIAARTGYAEQTLQNARWVCSKIPLAQRRETLTFTHAAEIVGRSQPKDYPQWIAKVETEGMSARELREQLRRASSKFTVEPHDSGTSSILEQARQFSRDFAAASRDGLSPRVKGELRSILATTLRELVD